MEREKEGEQMRIQGKKQVGGENERESEQA
jgi:hypothetical protein